MSGRKPPLPDELALFKAAVGDAHTLPHHGKLEPTAPQIQPIPKQRIRDEQQALVDSLSDHISYEDSMEAGEELVYLRTGLRRDTLKKLRRGHWVLQAELDLHGQTSIEARQSVNAFISLCHKRGLRCVRIIHGKGLGSKNREPILRTRVKHWLMQKDEVLAFCQARAVDGGSGAVVVLLKSPNTPTRGSA